MAESAGHMLCDTNILWWAALFIEIGAKENIPDHDILAVIRIPLTQLLAVMPAMHTGRIKDIRYGAKAHLDIAMGQHADKGRNRPDPCNDHHRRTQ